MKKIIFASNNQHKISEVKEILSDYEVLTIKDCGFEGDIEENATTLIGNSLIKAKTIYKFIASKGSTLPVLADDSGLFVDVLDGAPGVLTARYASVDGSTPTDEENRAKLLIEMEGAVNRKANFACAMVMYNGEDDIKVGVGQTFGEISELESGKLDFGYDPLFYSYDLEEKFSEVSDDEKNSVSHRGRAIKNLIENPKRILCMNLDALHFENIKKGEKVYEVRLNDEKRQNLSVGDFINFTNNTTLETLVVKVTELLHFNSFEEMAKALDYSQIGFNTLTEKEVLDTYHTYYEEEKEHQYGVLAIKIELV